jgi:gas vesicle protein
MGFGRFLLGLIIGGIAGAGLGLVVQPAPRGSGQKRQNGEQMIAPVTFRLDRARKLMEQARAAFDQGRSTAIEAGQSARVRTSEAAHTAGASVIHAEESAAHEAAAVSNRVTGGIQGFTAELKSRWREAVSEGKQAAAETEAELRRRYLEDTKRI